jgi:glycerophosphoryl diester phosphodiesterase
MKNIFLSPKTVVFLLLLVFSSAFSQTGYFKKGIPAGKILVASHRGDWRNYPENSIKAIEGAIRMGVDIVEIDLHKTKDGQLIVMHDPKLDRTTNGKGAIAETSMEDIRKLFLKSGVGILTREKVPTLEEVLLYIKDKRIMLNLDKSWNYIPEIIALLEKTGTAEQIILKGNKSAPELKKEVGDTMDHLMYMPMVWPLDYSIYKRDQAIDPAQYVQEFHQLFAPAAYEVIIKDDTAAADELLKQIRKSGAAVWINALWPELCAGHDDDLAIDHPDENWGWIIRKGATIIQTDRPEALIRYLKSKKIKYED